jgi:predicted N-formylglutamate amidohydrolase
VECGHGQSEFLLLCDHAGARVPRSLAALGLKAGDLQRHIAWDIGAAAVGRKLAQRLDAMLVLQTYSRLVIDCNRPPGSAQSILPLSEDTPIPGNQSVTHEDARLRELEIFRPYHELILAELAAREARRRPVVLVALHSFTPVYRGVRRPWHAGVLYNRDHRLAAALLRVLARDTALVVGDNHPYAVSDDTDYTIPVHAEARGLLHVGIELRQDLVADEAGQEEWAVRLADALPSAVAEIAT